MGIQDKNTKNSTKSKNYLKSKSLSELENLTLIALVYCYKAKCTVQWAEEDIRKNVCRLNSKRASKNYTQIGSSQTTHDLDAGWRDFNLRERILQV